MSKALAKAGHWLGGVAAALGVALWLAPGALHAQSGAAQQAKDTSHKGPAASRPTMVRQAKDGASKDGAAGARNAGVASGDCILAKGATGKQPAPDVRVQRIEMDHFTVKGSTNPAAQRPTYGDITSQAPAGSTDKCAGGGKVTVKTLRDTVKD